MAKSTTKPPNPFIGRWKIVSMSLWDQDFVDEEVEGYFEFKKKADGQFHFGYVRGQIDYRLTTREGIPTLEWTWDGLDEMTPVQGRGWSTLQGDQLHGEILFHLGDESTFIAKKTK